jgi:hypothetical protein
MNLARICGHLLLWGGFLCGAVLAVRRTEVPDNPWSTIPWLAYGIALNTAVAGVVLLRLTKPTGRLRSERHADDVDQLDAALNRLHEQLRVWQMGKDKPPVHRVHGQIDELLSPDLALFAELRESLIDSFGLQQYAGIMTHFALAERTINRMWSASADGYIDEVDVCIDRAVAHLETAIERLSEARSIEANWAVDQHC